MIFCGWKPQYASKEKTDVGGSVAPNKDGVELLGGDEGEISGDVTDESMQKSPKASSENCFGFSPLGNSSVGVEDYCTRGNLARVSYPSVVVCWAISLSKHYTCAGEPGSVSATTFLDFQWHTESFCILGQHSAAIAAKWDPHGA